MNPKKRKEPSDAECAIGPGDEQEIEGPPLKRQKKKTDDSIHAPAQPSQPLSRAQKQIQKRREKERKERRERRERKRIGPVRKKSYPGRASLIERSSYNAKGLDSMMSVLDFSKEAEPWQFGQDTKTLYLKHAMAEDNHFKVLFNTLRDLEAQNIKPGERGHPSYYKRKWCGWQAEELRRSGALDMIGCIASDLQNPVHAILHINNFDRCPRAIYEQLLPSLRLATQFLTHPACIRYWITLWFGTRDPDPVLAQEKGYKVWRLPKLEEYSQEAASRTLEKLEQMGNHVTFDFRSDTSRGNQYCFGMARCESKLIKSTHQYLPTETTEHGQAWEDLLSKSAMDDTFDPEKIFTRIHLSMDYYRYLKYIKKLTYADESVRLRFNLIFAVLICHEIAHCVEMRIRIKEFGRDFRRAGRPWNRMPFLRNEETFLFDWDIAEVGHGFEMATFGSLLQPINQRCDGANGVFTAPYPPTTSSPVFHAVSMAYINSIQQQTFWDDQSVSEVAKLLRAPKTGVPSIRSSCVTTLSWKDYLQIQERQGKGHYHTEDLYEPPINDALHSAEQPLSASSGAKNDRGGSADASGSGSEPSLPTSPSDVALKKPEDLTVVDKWKLAAENFVLEGGLSHGFHMQRTMGTLILPEKLQPWNPDAWQQEQLDNLLYMRLNKKKAPHATSDQQHIEYVRPDDPMDEQRIPETPNASYENLAKTAAIAENPVKAEKWRCLEELVWLQDGSNRVLQFLHARDANELDFTDSEHLDPDRADSFGPEVMEQLDRLRTAFIRARIDEERKATVTFPALVKVTSEDRRQDILNFFRPRHMRVKTGGLPTPPQSFNKETTQRPTSEDIGTEKANHVGSQNSDEKADEIESPEAAETEIKTGKEARDAGSVKSDQDSNPAREPFQIDHGLKHYSDVVEQVDLGSSMADKYVSGSHPQMGLATPPRSEKGDQPPWTDGKEILDIPVTLRQPPGPSRLQESSPAQGPNYHDLVRYDEDSGDSSWPPWTDQDYVDLEEPGEQHGIGYERPSGQQDSDQ